MRKYAWGIPNDEALEVIAAHSPIIEIGAGAGYWAWLLRQKGATVAAYDNEPKPSFLNGYRSRCEVPWTEVVAGSSEKVQEHPGHTLFLCWTPPFDPMDHKALSLYTGSRVLFVGTREHDYIGSRPFYDELARSWRLLGETAIPNWPDTSDRLMVYERAA